MITKHYQCLNSRKILIYLAKIIKDPDCSLNWKFREIYCTKLRIMVIWFHFRKMSWNICRHTYILVHSHTLTYRHSVTTRCSTFQGQHSEITNRSSPTYTHTHPPALAFIKGSNYAVHRNAEQENQYAIRMCLWMYNICVKRTFTVTAIRRNGELISAKCYPYFRSTKVTRLFNYVYTHSFVAILPPVE